MGSAIAERLISENFVNSKELAVVEKELGKVAKLKRTGVITTKKVDEVLGKKQLIILAVKPQHIKSALRVLFKKINSESFIISIAAGVKIATIKKGTRHNRVVRAMTNTPLQVGAAMTGWIASKEVSATQKAEARKIFQLFGADLEVEKEQDIDLVTAVSGSGPAYFFAFAEVLQKAAEKLGIESKIAQKMILQTWLGAGKLAESSGESFDILREKVTSKGGTTAAALQVFTEGQIEEIAEKALKAAHRRAKELGQ